MSHGRGSFPSCRQWECPRGFEGSELLLQSLLEHRWSANVQARKKSRDKGRARGREKGSRNQQQGKKPMKGRKKRNKINRSLWQLCDDKHWDERTDTRPSNSCELKVYKGSFLPHTPTLQDLNSGRQKTTDSVSAQPDWDIP